MIFGKKIKASFENIENGVRIDIENFPSGISISALDFGKDLAKRSVEGYTPNPNEEIDVISGISDEKTTGEKISFIYSFGDFIAGMILIGTLSKKLLNNFSKAIPIEVGGISYGDKNEAYIRVAIQKMILTEDALGSVIEISFPIDVDINSIKSEFSNMVFSLVPEVEAIEFGFGISASKKAISNYGNYPKIAKIALGPNLSHKIPALALSYDIVFEAIANFVTLNNK